MKPRSASAKSRGKGPAIPFVFGCNARKRPATANLECTPPSLIASTRRNAARERRYPASAEMRRKKPERQWLPTTGYGGPKVERPGPPAAPAMIPERVAPSLVLF